MMVHSWAASSLFGVRENQSMEACVARCSDGVFFRCLNRFNFRRSFKPMASIHAASGSLSPSSLSEKILGNSLQIFKTLISCLFDSRKAMLRFFPFSFFFLFFLIGITSCCCHVGVQFRKTNMSWIEEGVIATNVRLGTGVFLFLLKLSRRMFRIIVSKFCCLVLKL